MSQHRGKNERFLRLILLGIILMIVAVALNACGVKADPQPPLNPVEIGHGHPAYRNDDDSPSLRQQPNQPSDQKDDQDDDEE